MFKKILGLLLLPLCSIAQQAEFDAFANRFYTFQEYANGRLPGVVQKQKNYYLNTKLSYINSMPAND